MLKGPQLLLATWVILTALLILLIPVHAMAEIPGLITNQGRLTTPAGNPVPNGIHFLRFQIYDAAVSGNVLWSSGFQPVQVASGTYNYVLGQDAPLPNGLFTGGASRWLGITVGTDPELVPRTRLTSVGYSFVSQNADSVSWNGIKNIPAGFADGVDNAGTGDITAVNTSGGLTGGATSGDANLSIAPGGVTSNHIADNSIVNADVNTNAALAPSKISGVAATLSGDQVFVDSNVFAGDVRVGDSTIHINNNGIVIGRTLFSPSNDYVIDLKRTFSTTATRYGMRSQIANASTGTLFGLYGRAESLTAGRLNGGACFGVHGEGISDADARVGTFGYAQPITVAISSGESIGAKGEGWFGETTYGVHGLARSSEDGFGVYGRAQTILNFAAGVYGYGYQCLASAWGVYGTATTNDGAGYGVYGRAQGNDGGGYGVYGTAIGNTGVNWAGYFSGDVNVTGTIFTPAKLTRIDHPTDPEGKYLLLSSVDSPEMLNTHCGNAILDAAGEATVLLPEAFARVCRDYRYQLTCVGGYAPVYIAQEVTGNEFRIAGGTEGLKVSWQIIALRDDNFARTFPLSNEKAKRPDELGKYLHPAAFGLDEASGIDYEQNRPVGKQSDSQPSSGRP